MPELKPIGDVVLGFFVSLTSPLAANIRGKGGSSASAKDAVFAFAKEKGLTYARYYKDDKPEGNGTDGVFVGYRVEHVVEKPWPWFKQWDVLKQDVDALNSKLTSLLSDIEPLMEGDEHARPELLVDQYKTRENASKFLSE